MKSKYNVFVSSSRCYVPARFHYYLLAVRQVQTGPLFPRRGPRGNGKRHSIICRPANAPFGTAEIIARRCHRPHTTRHARTRKTFPERNNNDDHSDRPPLAEIRDERVQTRLRPPPALRGEPVDEDPTVEVVVFVLEYPSLPTLEFLLEFLPPQIIRLDLDPLGPLDVAAYLGEAEAPLLLDVGTLGTLDYPRIHHHGLPHPILRIAALVVHHEAFVHPDLGRRQPHAPRGVHDEEHLLGECRCFASGTGEIPDGYLGIRRTEGRVGIFEHAEIRTLDCTGIDFLLVLRGRARAAAEQRGGGGGGGG